MKLKYTVFIIISTLFCLSLCACNNGNTQKVNYGQTLKAPLESCLTKAKINGKPQDIDVRIPNDTEADILFTVNDKPLRAEMFKDNSDSNSWYVMDIMRTDVDDHYYWESEGLSSDLASEHTIYNFQTEKIISEKVEPPISHMPSDNSNTPPTESVTSNPLLLTELTVKNETSGTGGIIGTYGIVYVSKSDLKSVTNDQFTEFVNTRVKGSGHSWISIICDDGTGICFEGSQPEFAEYGTVNDEGTIVQKEGTITYKNGNYVYQKKS